MATSTPQLPTLFLSHSGRQKGFVWSLYLELMNINHAPFFDQDAGEDSLPRGSPFAIQIVEACRACKLGLVVLSHDYIESLWPMLELQQLLFHNSNEPHNVYPIFYELEPADLSNEKNLNRWRSFWQKNEVSWHAKLQNLFTVDPSTSASGFQPILDINSWPKALEMLRSRSGDIRPNNKHDPAFVQTIVSNICKRFPPPQSFLMDDSFKGADHIQQEIHKLFEEQEERRGRSDVDCRTPIVVGMHGVGGAGKTTVCKYMVNFYSKEYPGSCCFLQFPTKEEDESKSLVQSMKDILCARGNLRQENLDSIKSVDQAMIPFRELLRRYKVFLIVDNVWDWALQLVKQVVTMEFKPESRLLVTARSVDLLERLNKEVVTMSTMKIVHVPSISEEEAIEALKAYSWMSSQLSLRVEDFRGLARSCCFGGRCHPLLLKAVGARLRHVGGHTCSTQAWAHLISRLQADIKYGDGNLETNVVNVLKTSFEALRSQLKDTFLKLGTCIPAFYDKYSLKGPLCDWLRMISGDGSPTVEDTRNQLLELKYHGLIEIQEGKVMLHDLQMLLIESIVRENNGEPQCFLFRGGNVKTLSRASPEWRRPKYIYGEAKNSIICETSARRWLKHMCFLFGRRVCMSPNWQCIEVLQLQDDQHWPIGCGWYVKHVESLKLSVKHMQSLRHLVLEGFRNLQEVGGWHGATNLISVKLDGCCVEKVESMTCLCRLESLVISHRFSRQGVIILEGGNDLRKFLGHLPELRELELSNHKNKWVNLEILSTICPSLQQLNMSESEIVNFPSFNLRQLRVLDLSRCERLQSREGSVCNLTALEELRLAGCKKLEHIPDLKLLVNLRVLELHYCKALEEVKVGDAVPLTTLSLESCDALKEVKVGDAAVASLKHLSLTYGYWHFSTLSCSPLPISAFTNLRRLDIGQEEPGSTAEVYL